MTQNSKFCSESVENIVGKEENVGYQHFLLFLPCVEKTFFSRMLKVGFVVRVSSLLNISNNFKQCREQIRYCLTHSHIPHDTF